MSLDPCEDAVQVARGILIAVILTASVLAQLSCGGDGDTPVTDTGAQEALIERMTARRWWNGNMLLSSELWTFSADGGVVLEKATDNMDGHLRVERREGVYSVSRWRAADGSFDVVSSSVELASSSIRSQIAVSLHVGLSPANACPPPSPRAWMSYRSCSTCQAAVYALVTGATTCGHHQGVVTECWFMQLASAARTLPSSRWLV